MKKSPSLHVQCITDVIKVPTGAGSLQVSRNNLALTMSVIRIKNSDTMCLARASHRDGYPRT